jgi:hypothetical protein
VLTPVLELEDVLQFEFHREHVAAPPLHHQPGPTRRDVPLQAIESRASSDPGNRALPSTGRPPA